MKIKKLTFKQMENLEGGISDKLYWALLCSGVGALYSFVNIYVGIGVGFICAMWGPSLDVPPAANLREPGDLQRITLPSGSGSNLK